MLIRFIKNSILLLIVTGVIIGCANRGRPSGGEKDTTPPEIVRSVPENYTTNFAADEIRIYFNEFVKLKDLQKQLIISPPMQTQPDIRPLSIASKYISIKIKDTLEPNTTYAFNFGESIVDNNEENPYPYYRYVFSTGDVIDSLSVKGAVFDAENRRADSFISVMLYELDSTYTDSIVYKEKPRYVTNTLDSLTTFSIDNIKEGIYKLVALKDQNSNFRFDPKDDKIGFYNDTIKVPTDTIYNIKLFKEQLDFKTFRPIQIGEQRLAFPFEGNADSMTIAIQNDTLRNFEFRTTRDAKADSLYYWYKPKLELDSTLFVITNKTFTDTLKHRFKKANKDSLHITPKKAGTLEFSDVFTLEGTTPFVKIDTSKITLIDRDSITIGYNIELDTLYNAYRFPFELKADNRYAMQVLPDAITDFYGTVNDTLNFQFSTKKTSDYGNIRLNIINAQFPLIVQLTNEKGEVQYETYTEDYPIVDFNNIEPKQYEIRVIFDTNKNGKYDSGNYLKKIQPERVSYMKPIDPVRANFDFILEFILD